MTKAASLRTVWWTFHRWIGVGLGVLLVPIALSGALLVWHDQIDAVVHPGRYALSGAALLQPQAYLASAGKALEAGVQATSVRFPEAEGWPVVVTARGAPRDGGFARSVSVYLDPPTARVLDVVDFRSSWYGWLHRFHENLTIPEYSGRSIVGWVGIGMLIMALTGIWLWWPRTGALLPGLRWRRAAYTTTNLHHLIGFWISIPLAVVSFTGIYLGFPQVARQTMSAVAPMAPQGQRPGFGLVARDTRLTADGALDAALASEPGARAAVIFLPTAPASNTGRGRARGGEGQREQGQKEQGTREQPAREAGARNGQGPIWRVQLREAQSEEIATVTVDDRSGAVARQSHPLTGDRAAQWLRAIHEGGRGGLLWRFVVFLTGVCPLVFAVTGVTMWWRGRRGRRRAAASAPATAGELQAAE